MSVLQREQPPASWVEHAVRYAVTRGSSSGVDIKGNVSDEPQEGLVPAFSASGQDVWVATPKFHGDGLVLSAVGARCGKCFRARGSWNVVANTQVFLPRRGFDADYLWYVFNREDFWLKGGSAQPYIMVPMSISQTWRFPPEPDQRAIADFLDNKTAAIDSLIAKKERLIELLQEKRQALITQAVTKGLDPNVPTQDSGIEWLGGIPTHWEMRRLKQLSHRISGRLVYQPAQYFSDDGVPFIMANNVTERGLVLHGETKFVPAEINARFAHHALREGDVVTVRVGAPGVTAVVPAEADGLNCGSLMIIRQNRSFDSHWLAFVMNSPVVRAQIDLVQYGAAQEQINITDAVNFWIPTPPLEEQVSVANHLSEGCRRLDETVDGVQRQIDKLREYRQALISAAVTGKLDVTKERAA